MIYQIFLKHKLLILFFIIFLFILSAVVLIIINNLGGNNQENDPGIAPIPTEYPDFRKEKIVDTNHISEIASTLHWINNVELSYTVYDPSILRFVVKRTNGKNSSVLLNTEMFRIPLFLWSQKNNLLLISDQGVPNKTYLHINSQIQDLELAGFGHSISPENDKIFYFQWDGRTEESVPYVYSLESGTSEKLGANLPMFIESYWSPSGADILLYNYSIETTESQLYRYNFASNSVTVVSNDNPSSPMWSEDGSKISYLDKVGLHVVSLSTNKSSLIYPSEGNYYISYAWTGSNTIFLVDSKGKPTYFLIDTENQQREEVAYNLPISAQQRIQIAISPDKKTLALASEKNGMYLLRR